MCVNILFRIDLRKCNQSEGFAQDRLEWCNRIHVADHNILSSLSYNHTPNWVCITPQVTSYKIRYYNLFIYLLFEWYDTIIILCVKMKKAAHEVGTLCSYSPSDYFNGVIFLVKFCNFLDRFTKIFLSFILSFFFKLTKCATNLKINMT